jgi:hypothetical protein
MRERGHLSTSAHASHITGRSMRRFLYSLPLHLISPKSQVLSLSILNMHTSLAARVEGFDYSRVTKVPAQFKEVTRSGSRAYVGGV